jgi:hypothetical protein
MTATPRNAPAADAHGYLTRDGAAINADLTAEDTARAVTAHTVVCTRNPACPR